MKRILLTFLLVIPFSLLTLRAQQSVSIGDITVKPNAVLYLKGNGNQGLIIPIVTSTGTFGDVGMVVYNSTDKKIYYHDGSGWSQVGAGGGGTPTTEVDGIIGNEVSQINTNGGIELTGSGTAVSPLRVGLITGTTDGQILKWNNTTKKWELGSDNSGGAPIVDNTTIELNAGTLRVKDGGITDAKIVNVSPGKLSSASATAGQVLKWNGSSWAPAADAGTSYTQGAGISISGTTIGAATDNVSIETNAGNLRVRDGGITDAKIAGVSPGKIGQASATSGQVLKWNGTSWAPAADAGTSYSAGTGISVTGSVIGIASNGVSSTELRSDATINTNRAVTTNHIQDNAVTNAKIGSVDAGKINTGTLGIARGGTGIVTTPANGVLLIGNGTGYSSSTLTAGSGINISNGAGTITVSSAGMTNPMTTAGDMIFQSVGGTPARLPVSPGILKSDGVNLAWGALDLTSGVFNALPVGNGGTGSTSLTGVLVGNGSGPFTAIQSSVANQYLRRNTANSAYEFSALSVTDADVSPTAAIAGSKVIPNFGTQNLVVGAMTTINTAQYTWPNATAPGFLQSNSSGVLSWVPAPGGFNTVNVIPKGSAGGFVASSIMDDGTSVDITNNQSNAAGLNISNGAGVTSAGLGRGALNVRARGTGTDGAFGLATMVDGDGQGQYLGVFSLVQGTASMSNRAVVGVAHGTNANVGVEAVVDGNIGTNFGLRASLNGTQANEKFGLYMTVNGAGNKYGVYTSGENYNFFSGNIGLSETLPIRRIDVRSPNYGISHNDGAIRVTSHVGTTLSGADPNGAGSIGTESNHSFSIYTNNSVKATFLPGGNVGIGMNNPANAQVHILNESATDYALNLETTQASGAAGMVRFLRNGTLNGSITESGGVVVYGAFTGVHYAHIDKPADRGMLMSLTGSNVPLNKNYPSGEPVYGVTLSTTANDSKLLGSYFAPLEDPSAPDIHQVMAVGNGDMWVVDNGTDLSVGDYLISSSVTGHAMKDNADFEVAYIVGRVAEPVKWSAVTDSINGVKHKRISVFFESFILNHKGDRLEKELNELKREVEYLKKLIGVEAKKK
jgi:hypothetical protein